MNTGNFILRRALRGSSLALAALAGACSHVANAPSSLQAAPAISCAQLSSLSLPSSPSTAFAVLSAQSFEAGPLPAGTPATTNPPMRRAQALPAYCRVKARISPAINFELWLPQTAWNGRFQQIGVHRFGGELDYADMAWQLAQGYAVASSDTGHQGQAALPWMQNPQQVLDYGSRAVHETALKAKAITAAFYGRPAEYAYFNGCSTGGKEALMEAQRYPSDFQGISVGDPNFDQIGNRAQYIWNAQATFMNEATRLTTAQLELVHTKVLETCDRLDGVADGVIEDPRQCRFRPESLACQPGQAAGECLTPAQIGAFNSLYEGPSNPSTGQRIYAGWSAGSELDWRGIIGGPNVFPTAEQFFRNMVFRDASWDWRRFDFDKDWTHAMANFGPLVNADDADLRAFEQAGGKLLHYHGWGDVNHAPMQSVRYYDNVVETMGRGVPSGQAGQRVARFYRLFMVPGSSGCSSAGPHPDQFDPMDALRSWVEDQQTPERIVVRTPAPLQRTRALCPYPKVAVYGGRGDVFDEKSFSCAYTPAR
jgi:feruloyl esterase